MLLFLFSVMACTDSFGNRPKTNLRPYPGQPKSNMKVGHHARPSLLTRSQDHGDVPY